MFVKFINKEGNIEIVESVEKVDFKGTKFLVFPEGKKEFYIEKDNFLECYR